MLIPTSINTSHFRGRTRDYCLGNTCYFISTDQKWLLGLLNSTLIEWFYGSISNRIRGGYMRAFSQFMGQIPIPAASADEQKWCERLAEALIYLNRPEVTSGGGVGSVA